jgi:hypothetical protein
LVTGPDRRESRPLERLAAGTADAFLGLVGALGARKLRDRYRSIDAEGLARALVTLALDHSEDGVYESTRLQRLANEVPGKSWGGASRRT